MCIRDSAKAVVLATGTYLKARCLYGEVVNYTGPNGLQAANYLSQSLKEDVYKRQGRTYDKGIKSISWI